MLLMVTNRRPTTRGYGDEEQSGFRYHYLHNYLDGERGSDGFGDGGGAEKDKKAFSAVLLAELQRLKDVAGIGTPKVGLYIHGYNNDWQDSIDELVDMHAALSRAIGYDPVLVGFSWPSSGRTGRYLSDREEVRDSVPAFVRFLGDIHEFLLETEPRCFATSYCIAHSMGNYLLRKGTEYLSDHLGTPVGRAMFNETVMLAPDIAAKDVERDGKGQYIADFSRRVHVYYSKHDRALKASSAKRFGGNRLGRHGPEDFTNLPANVVAIDAKKYANSDAVDAASVKDRKGETPSVHSSHRYQPSIIADIAQVISSVDRSLIPNRREVAQLSDLPSLRPNHYGLT